MQTKHYKNLYIKLPTNQQEQNKLLQNIEKKDNQRLKQNYNCTYNQK